MEFEGWLRGLGLERYAESFRANDIGPDVLGELTDADLTSLGVSLGDRKRLRMALAGLRDGATPDAPAPRPGADRRQLTVMFVDLVGSTALSTHLDPEELRDVIQAYQNAVAMEIARLEGHVAKLMGDGVLAYFGWPRAHEDAAERSVRAGFAVTHAVARLPHTAAGPLAARVGIATGLVVVGDLMGEGAAQEEAVLGETPNLAARLQALADPGTVVVASSTRRLLGRLFGFTDLGPQRLAGFPGPVTAFRVALSETAHDRFEALRGQQLTPLVGREDELGLLLDRWRRARDGQGQAVLISGDAGIGKSRLLQSLRDRIASESHTRLRYFCSPYHQDTAFHPILDQLERGARLRRGDTASVKLDKLEALFALGGGVVAEATMLTAGLLGIATEPRYEVPALGPQGRKAKLREIWLQQLDSLASQRPVLILIEDAHWIDPTSLDLFDLVIERIQRLPVLLLVSFRPQSPPEWRHHPHVTSLSLERLSPGHSATLLRRSGTSTGLPGPVLDQIVAKADGVPLFLEELIKAVTESRLSEDGAGRWHPIDQLPPLAVPATLHDSLMARLDHLGPVKKVAQVAAAIGREFSTDLLSAVTGIQDGALDDALAKLAAAELIFPRSQPPVAVFTFKHALIQDTAYASLLRGLRQKIHARIAAALREQRGDCPPEIMAHHLTAAGEADLSVEFWERAGRHAVSSAASKEAAAHFQRALAQLQSLPDTAERRRREASLQDALGGALVHVTGPASEALATAYARARDLCQQAGDTKPQFVAEWNLWHVYYSRAEYGDAEVIAERLMNVAEQQNDPDLLLQACHVEWVALGTGADYGAAQACCERGWALYDEKRHGRHAFAFGAHDPGVCSRNQCAAASWALGQPDRARACQEQGLALARALDHPLIVVNALARSLPLLQLCRDLKTLEARATTTIALATEQDFPNYRIDAEILRAWASRERSAPGTTVRLIDAGLVDRQRLGSIWQRPYFLSLLADAQACDGALDEALDTIDQALEQGRSTGEIWHEPELLRIKGEVLRQLAMDDAAEQFFAEGLALAQTTSARAWELRIATSLARLWASQSRRESARQLLALVYGAFNEGFGTPDLQDARTLLTGLT